MGRAQQRAAETTDPTFKEVWEQTAKRHAEQAAQLRQQAEGLAHRAAAAPKPEQTTSTSPSQPPPIATGSKTAGGIAEPVAPASPAKPPPEMATKPGNCDDSAVSESL